MPRTFHRVTALLTAALLSGCANVVPRYDVPDDPNSKSPTVRSIIDEVTCELDEMLAEKTFRDFFLDNDLVAALQLTLTVNDTGSLAPTFTYMSGPFSFNAGANYSRAREQNYTETLYYSMHNLYEDSKQYLRDGKIPECKHVADTNLAGNLGLREAVGIALQSPNLYTDKKLNGTDGAFGGYVQFVITKNLNAVGPTFSLTHFKGPGSFAGVSEINTDKLIFAFAKDTSTDRKKPGFGKARAHLETININLLGNQLSLLGSIVR